MPCDWWLSDHAAENRFHLRIQGFDLNDPQRQLSATRRFLTCSARSVRFSVRRSWKIWIASFGNNSLSIRSG